MEPMDAARLRSSAAGADRQPKRRPAKSALAGGPPAALWALQQTAGNTAVQRLIQGSRGAAGTGFRVPGVPLPDGVRSRMETALGGEFSQVRVHANDESAQQSDALGASAFTVGQDVAFAAGTYQPGTVLGDALLAHELAHVSQQDSVDDRPVPAAFRTPRDGDEHAEDDANRAAAQAVLSLHGSPTKSPDRPSGLLSRIKTGLRLHRCTPKLGAAMGKVQPKRVDWRGSQPMTASHGNNRVNPGWTPGAVDHAVSYTKGAAPVVDAQFDVGPFQPPPPGMTVSVRVTEGGAVRGSVAGIAPAASVAVPGLVLTGLTRSSAVGSSSYSLQWEVSVDGATWTPACSTATHPVHWTYGTPKISPTPSIAVANATRYAAGATSPGDVAARIRSGPRSVDGLAYKPDDPIDTDPLDVYTNGVGICTDYANLLSVLARAVGLNANTVMFWGGFESLGRLVWSSLAGDYTTIKHVKAGKPAFNPPGNPAGWDFSYHAIARIEGALQDAALDRAGYDAEAVKNGLVIHLFELAGGALPAATRGAPFNQRVPRKDHVVAVATHDFGPLLTLADFGLVVPLSIPAGAASPVEVGGVTFTITAGTLPPGLVLDPHTGIISGTPPKKSPKKTYTFTMESSGAGLTASGTFSVTVG